MSGPLMRKYLDILNENQLDEIVGNLFGGKDPKKPTRQYIKMCKHYLEIAVNDLMRDIKNTIPIKQLQE